MRYQHKQLLKRLGTWLTLLGYLAIMVTALWLLGYALKPY